MALANTSGASALAFQSTTFDAVMIDGKPWLRVHQIGEALEYKHPDRSMTNLYNANQDEFTDRMTAVVKLDTAGGAQDTRIFSLRGAHLLAMFARTAKAAEFRRWVLDVLDHEVERQSAAPAPARQLAPPPKLSRDDLSFTRRDAQGRLINWSVNPRCRLWHEGLDRGEAFFREVAELAAHDEREAYDAIRFAFGDEWQPPTSGSSEWSSGMPGEEAGFADALARAVIEGLRARRRGAEPYRPERKPRRGRAPGQLGAPRAAATLLPAVRTPPTQQHLLA